jgi:Leucine-rich repeat (LRR) protein
MPPKEKPQLTKEEIDLLRWWISSGASFDKKVKDLPQPAKIKVVLTSLQSGNAKEQPSPSFIPDTPVEKADTAIIAQLKKRGIAVVPVAQNSNYLSASFIAVDTVTAKDIAALIPVSRQLIWLKLGNTRVTDAALHELDKLTALTRLSLERTAITDESTERIKSLTLLQYLNLSGTAVSSRGLALLTGLKKLQYLYIYGIAITADEFNRLAKNLPATRIDTGGYKVPVLASDTTLVKAKSE